MLRIGMIVLTAGVIALGAAVGQDKKAPEVKKSPEIKIPETKKVEAKKAPLIQIPEVKKAEAKKKAPLIKIPEVKKAAEAKKAPEIAPLKGESKTFDLFDGKTLTGWEGFDHYWSVKDGVIIGKNTKPILQSTYLVTKEKFTDFRLTFDFKLAESEMHSGVAFWGKINPNVRPDPEKEQTKYTYQGHLVMFPSGWGMYDLFRRMGLKVDGGPGKKAGKQHDWNHIEVLAQGNRVRVAANGVAIVDWRDPQPELIEAGPIGLQLHSNKVPQEVQFKNLKIETFPREDRLITVK